MDKNEKKLKKIIDNLYKKQQQEIKKMYINLASFIDEEIKDYDEEEYTEQDLNDLKKKIKNELKNNNKELKNLIKNNIELIVKNTIKIDKEFYIRIDKIYNTNLASRYKLDEAKILDRVYKDINSGKIYRDNYSLSERIWGNNKGILKDIDRIINNGLKNKLSPIHIAKDLEKYISPSSKKPSYWNKYYPGIKGSIDYNAHRLSRTVLTHAHQLSVAERIKNNPVLDSVVYHSSGSSRTCSMCADRDGMVYKADDFPLDHPNGACYMTAYIPDNVNELIADFINEEFSE